MLSFSQHLTEKPLTPQQRRKKGIIMKRLAPKIARKRAISMKKKAGTEKIEKRANKAALNLLRKKILKGKSYEELPYQSRVELDKKIEKKKTLLKTLAKKLRPSIKKQEIERLKSARSK